VLESVQSSENVGGFLKWGAVIWWAPTLEPGALTGRLAFRQDMALKYLLNRSGASPYPLFMNDLLSLTPAQLNHAADLKEKIEKLENELTSLLGSNSPVAPKRGPGRPKKILTVGTIQLPKLKRRKMSAAGRARIAAAAKARWAKAKAAGKTSL
jgi:hypothetical protein